MKKIVMVLLIIIVLLEGVVIAWQFSTYRKVDAEMEKLFLSQSVIVISENPLTYVCQKKNAEQVFKVFMENMGWVCLDDEQMGAGYVFLKDSDKHLFILTFEKSYACWTFDRAWRN